VHSQFDFSQTLAERVVREFVPGLKMRVPIFAVSGVPLAPKKSLQKRKCGKRRMQDLGCQLLRKMASSPPRRFGGYNA
jgi:hypothetical protein